MTYKIDQKMKAIHILLLFSIIYNISRRAHIKMSPLLLRMGALETEHGSSTASVSCE